LEGLLDSSLAGDLSVLGQVLLINVVLSGDNAVVVGLAAAGLPAEERRQALWLGIAAATLLRVGFALVATRLLDVLGLLLAGGLLLLWVAWKLWRELRRAHRPAAARNPGAAKTFGEALTQIILADLSMSLDNALAVAGAALQHPAILAIGLVLSVLLMGTAAALLARLLERYRAIAYLGLLMILYVAAKMIWEGTHEVIGAIT
jgi:YjbE family integral membrane protein